MRARLWQNGNCSHEGIQAQIFLRSPVLFVDGFHSVNSHGSGLARVN